MAETLVVAGLWARPLAESACRAGWRVIAMDLFGDADTRRASAKWYRIGDPAAFAIDPALLHDALARAAGEAGVVGWVAGSGFEPIPEMLAAVAGLPLLGMPCGPVRRVRDPASFFGMLDRLGLLHPEVTFAPPAPSTGWLRKSAAASGGWHIQPAREDDARKSTAVYWQRLQAGTPMSALFLADGERARLVALNRLVVRPLALLQCVYHGALGPIRDSKLARQLEQALALLVPAFALRGLASLDFLAHEGRAWLLEVNPRPSASMVLHDGAWPGGLVQAHVRAVAGALPETAARHPEHLVGDLVVYADRSCHVGPALAEELAAAADCHDLPAAGTRFASGQPVCSISAAAVDAQALLAALDRRAAEIRACLETCEDAAP
jgi:predicted ATP-grasp superfamily ATP-dependent carboligase